MVRPAPLIVRTTCAALSLAALAACSGPQSALDPAGAQAGRLMPLMSLMTGVCGLAYLAVLVFLGASLWRARRRAAATGAPPDDCRLDRGMIAWGAFIVVGLTVLIVASFFTDRDLAAFGRQASLDVRVTAHQWWWRIEYRDPATGRWIETANELHLPAGRTARLALGSADVIHSFWVPNVAGKMDVIPGRANAIDVTPMRVGWYRGQCAEFCGAQHAHMALDVRIESPEAFTAWLAAQAAPVAAPADPVLQHGMRLVTAGSCARCHVVRGTAAAGRPGPDLTHLASRRSIAAGVAPMTRGALQGWVAQPQAVKPGTMMPAVALDGPDADAVGRYLESLR